MSIWSGEWAMMAMADDLLARRKAPSEPCTALSRATGFTLALCLVGVEGRKDGGYREVWRA